MSSLESLPLSLVMVICHETYHISQGHAKRINDYAAYLLGLSGSLLEGGDVQDTVGIDVEGDLDLRNSSRSRGDTREVELSEQVAVLGPGSLSLEDLDCVDEVDNGDQQASRG